VAVSPPDGIVRIDGPTTTALVELRAHPRLIYFGARLGDDVDLASIVVATSTGQRESQADEDPGLTLLPQSGGPFHGEPAIAIGGLTRFDLFDVERAPDRLTLLFLDKDLDCYVWLSWCMLETGVLSCWTEIDNKGTAVLPLSWFAALSLPLPDWAEEIMQVSGGWGAEFQLSRTPLRTGKIEKVNRTGRSGFDGANYEIVLEEEAKETSGRVLAAHLAWSGNSGGFVESLPTGERHLQLGEWLASGELTLQPGERYRSPEALLAFSAQGLNGVRRAYHAEFRSRQAAAGVGLGERKVHFNSWEAVYFDFDEQRMFDLAVQAAAVGAERFVLDDGWFKGRRNDRSSLGDWSVDAERFPRGLRPLISHVAQLGMDFGLWVEPEMISPDSDLYRAHPDWCLHARGSERPTQRKQLVLDLTIPDVREHLFARLSKLLTDLPIAYLKWDHNRDLFPAISSGRPVAREQVLGYYELVDRIRLAHPHVEIEGCASGGGRVDWGLVGRVARFWPSDNTDPLERLRIQQAMSLFYPLEVIGSHVGAAPNPTTGRLHTMAFRARVAMFGHFGVEANPGALSDDERAQLKLHAALYKRYRQLLHSGTLTFGRCADPDVTIATVVAINRTEALALVTRTTQSGTNVGPLIRFPGLASGRRYCVTLLEPWPTYTKERFAELEAWRDQPVFDSEVLEQVGLQLHVVRPETAWLIHLAEVR
jgi:alpha-galactosidase